MIGASATRVHPWWRGAIHFSLGNARHASSRLASHDPAHVRYSNGSREKNGLHPKFAVDVPGHWSPPMGRFTQYRPHLRVVAVAKVGCGWANSGRTGLWVSKPWLSILEEFLGNCGGDQVFRLQIAAEFQFGGAEILSEVVTPTDER